MKYFFILLFFVSISASADIGPGTEEFPSIFISNTLMAESFPIEQLEVGKKEFHIAPIVYSYKSDEKNYQYGDKFDVKGKGLVLSFASTLFENGWGQFGFGANMGGFKGDGSGMGYSVGAAGTTFNRSEYYGESKQEGFFASVYALMDPLKKWQIFSAPMFIGVNYVNYKDTLLVSGVVPSGQDPDGFTGSLSYQGEAKRNTFGLISGMAPSITVKEDWKLRILAVIAKPFTKAKFSETFDKTLPSKRNAKEERERIVGVIGISGVYLPWGISFSYIPKFITIGTEMYSFNYSFSF